MKRFVAIFLLLLSCDFMFAGPNPAIMVYPSCCGPECEKTKRGRGKKTDPRSPIPSNNY